MRTEAEIKNRIAEYEAKCSEIISLTEVDGATKDGKETLLRIHLKFTEIISQLKWVLDEQQVISDTLPQLQQPNVRRRAVGVECCYQCPFHIHDDGTDEAKWGKHWCEKMNGEIADADTIPDNCPLPFA